jgi:hypothetical protein
MGGHVDPQRLDQIMRDYWNDTFAKDYRLGMFLKTGVSLGALMLGQYERRFRMRVQKEEELQL